MKLTSLLQFVNRRIQVLDTAAKRAALLPASDFEKERLATFLAIDLYNLNAEWMRLYYIGVSTNQAFRKNGKRIIIGRKHQNIEDAISYAIEKTKSSDAKLKWLSTPLRFFEPSWNAVNTLPQLATVLNFPDKNAIATSITAGRDAISTLRAARNFYAHRNIDTRRLFWLQLADVLGWDSFEMPSADILNRRIGQFPNLFSFWLDDCARVNSEICDL